MRTIDMIEAELRVLATYRALCAQTGDPVRTTTAADQLLDERAELTTAVRTPELPDWCWR